MMIGVDIGFGFTKAFPGNVIFSSVFSEQGKRQFKNQGDELDNLELELDGKNYFVGRLAELEGGTGTFDRDNIIRHKVCLLTAIALSAKENYSGPVVLGLPVSDFHRKDQMQQLKGTYKIKLAGNQYTIEITEVMVFPQGGAAYFDMLLNDDGKVISTMADQRIGIIDIGEKTLDFVMMDKMRYVNERTSSMDTGMHKAYLRLLPVIQQELGISCLPHQIRDYLHKLPRQTELEYRRLANEIIDNLSTWWQFKDFDKIFIGGGGGILLHKYIRERINCDLVPDSQIANARGYLKCGTATKS